MRIPKVFFGTMLLGGVIHAGVNVDTGEINGASFRIDIPDNWNRSLVIFCHGYQGPNVVRYDKETPLSPWMPLLLHAGYGIARSGYAEAGAAIQPAALDTEMLRRYFVRKHGKPDSVYLIGFSMGGFISTLLMESMPGVYDGLLAACTAPGAGGQMYQRLFDLRAVFDYYFPSALPAPHEVPADFRSELAGAGKLLALLQAQPEKAAAVRQYAQIRNDKDLVHAVMLVTTILGELRQRAGGNVFDNHDTLYSGTPEDDALNAGVARYTAGPAAMRYLASIAYWPTGRLTGPMLALHTTYDPLVPPTLVNSYAPIALAAGSRHNYAQRFVKGAGHCAFRPEDVWNAFSDLVEWRKTGRRPVASAGE
jgi:pimeloyl-ACP methyl ester carboxylesterase